MTEVGLVGCPVVIVAGREDEDVVTTAEGVLEDTGGPEVDIRVVARGLVRRRAVEVPDAEGADVLDLLGDGLERQA
jgi:hypothetical protein